MNFKTIIVIFGIILSMVYSVQSQNQKPCSRIYRPICGSNGKMYSNECICENAQEYDSSLVCQTNVVSTEDECSTLSSESGSESASTTSDSA